MRTGKTSYNTFALQQAAFTLSPTSVAWTLQGYYGPHAHLRRARCEASTSTIGTTI